MVEHGQSDSRDEQIDTLLSRLLGTGTAPAEWRHRHLAAGQRIELTRPVPTASRLLNRRLLLKVAVAVFAIVVMGMFLFPAVRNDTDSTISGIAVAERLFSSPPAGRGRHIVAHNSPSLENASQGSAEVWSRADNDGQVETEVLAWSTDGELLGRTVETANEQWLDLGGDLYRFGDSLVGVAPHTSLLLGIRSIIDYDELLTRINTEAPDSVTVEETFSDDLRVITIDYTEAMTPESRQEFFEDFGTPPGRAGIEVKVQKDNEVPVSWEMFVIGEDGTRYVIIEINFDSWEELEFEEVSDSHFELEALTTSE